MAITVVNSDGYNRHDDPWSFTATSGRIVVGCLSARNWSVFFTPTSPYSMLAERSNNPVGEANCFLFGGVSSGGQNTAGANPGADNCGACIEFTGATMTSYISGGEAHGNSGTATAPAVTPTGPCIVVGVVATLSSSNWTPSGGWTKVSTDGPPANQSDWPRVALLYQIVTNPSGSYSPQASSSSNQWAAASAAIYAQPTGRSQGVII